MARSPKDSYNANQSDCSGCGSEHRDPKDKRRLHLIFAIILGGLAFLFLLFFFLFIYSSNREFIHKQSETCMIIKANLACWRRSILAPSRLETGHYTCWHFTVKHSNGTARTQYDDVDDFPIERDGCETEESCGLEEWPCRVGRHAANVSLRWRFPISETMYCFIGLTAATLFAIMAIARYVRDGRKRDDDDVSDDETVFHERFGTAGDKYARCSVQRGGEFSTDDVGSSSNLNVNDSAVPFSFRKRMPTWMQHRSTPSRESPSAVHFPSGHSP